jgi:hypothetical protein
MEICNLFFDYRIASNVPNATFIILNVAFGQRVDLKKRIFGSLGMILILFLIVTFLAKANSDSWQRQFLITVSLETGLDIPSEKIDSNIFIVSDSFGSGVDKHQLCNFPGIKS